MTCKISFIKVLLILSIASPGILSASDFFITSVDTTKKIAALTFDDGPNIYYTRKLLKILKKNNIKATFFLIGKQIERSPEILIQIDEEGHETGNHSYAHDRLYNLSETGLKEDIAKSQYIFYTYLDKLPVFIRPPYGKIRWHDQNIFKPYFDNIILWTIDSRDYKKHLTADQITERVVERIHPGAIILFHDSNPRTITAVPQIINELKSQGYRFVTISELIEAGANKNSNICEEF
ncbi:MAG: polysaccharide deacetylase family protein [bacterium]|nr:polysaccharide deacetylase family protein [bacterium]